MLEVDKRVYIYINKRHCINLSYNSNKLYPKRHFLHVLMIIFTLNLNNIKKEGFSKSNKRYNKILWYKCYIIHVKLYQYIHSLCPVYSTTILEMFKFRPLFYFKIWINFFILNYLMFLFLEEIDVVLSQNLLRTFL